MFAKITLVSLLLFAVPASAQQMTPILPKAQQMTLINSPYPNAETAAAERQYTPNPRSVAWPKTTKKKPHNAWINPADFPPLGPNPVAPGVTPAPGPAPLHITDPLEALFNAIAQVQNKIIDDLNTAQTLATTPIPNQSAATCVPPAVFTPAQPAAPETTAVVFNGSIVGATLTVNSVISGALAIGQTITDPASNLLMPGTVITGQTNATTWTVNNIQTVLNLPMQVDVSPGAPAVVASCNPPVVWDPLGAMCFPAMADFVRSIPGPAAFPTIPNGKGGLVTTAENIRLIDFAVKNFAASIKTIGYPDSLKIACDPWMLDYVTQANIDIAKLVKFGLGLALPGAGGLMSGILLNFIPMPVAERYGLGPLKKSIFPRGD